MSFPRERWHFPKSALDYDPYNDARSCRRCGNRLFSGDDMPWTPAIQRGLERCWRCPGVVCGYDQCRNKVATDPSNIPHDAPTHFADGSPIDKEYAENYFRKCRCSGRCRNCDNVTDKDCVRCFGCYFSEAVRYRACDNPGHHGKRQVPNSDGADIRAFSPVKSLPQRRWHCFHCIAQNKPMLWSEYEASQVTKDGEIPSVPGFQPVLLQHSYSYDPLAKLGGRENVWPNPQYRNYFAVIVPLAVYVPDRSRKSYRVVKARIIKGPKDGRLEWKTRPIEDNAIIGALEPFTFFVPEVHSTAPLYYAVHNHDGKLTVTTHKRYLAAVDSIMALPWGQLEAKTIVANYLDGKAWDGLS